MGSYTRRLNHLSYQRMFKAMVEDPYSAKELTVMTGLNIGVVQATLRSFHTCEPKLIYIAGWEKDERGAFTIRLYQFGQKPDAIRPAKSGIQASRDHRKRKKLRLLEAAMTIPAPPVYKIRGERTSNVPRNVPRVSLHEASIDAA